MAELLTLFLVGSDRQALLGRIPPNLHLLDLSSGSEDGAILQNLLPASPPLSRYPKYSAAQGLQRLRWAVLLPTRKLLRPAQAEVQGAQMPLADPQACGQHLVQQLEAGIADADSVGSSVHDA